GTGLPALGVAAGGKAFAALPHGFFASACFGTAGSGRGSWAWPLAASRRCGVAGGPLYSRRCQRGHAARRRAALAASRRRPFTAYPPSRALSRGGGTLAAPHI